MTPPSSPDELTTVFAHLQGMLLSTQDATAAVHQLARAAHRMVPAAAGAGVSLIDETGTRVTAAATDTVVEAADALQYELGQGPCLSAWATREPQHVADTAQDPRWTRWQAAAADAPVRLSASLKAALQSRETVALAAGVLMSRRGLDAEAAREALLADARARGRSVAESAADVLETGRDR
ncbi:MAG: GAF domain-containing protein [Actinomycetota bacterium]